MFKNEQKMQEWLSNELKDNNNLTDIIEDYEESSESSNAIRNRIVNSFKYCLKSLDVIEVISENENISLRDGDILKPDFLLYSPTTESIIILELKNIANPTRQVGTELGAYSSEVKTYLPFMSDGDIVHVIISREWPTLLRHYIFHEIYWLNRKVLCLEPVENEKGEIKLQVLDSHKFLEEIDNSKFCNMHLAGYQLCIYDDELYRGGVKTRLDKFLPQIKTSIYAMGAKAAILNNHGFAFLWKEHRNNSLAPYNITIINIAPFKLLERQLHNCSDKLGMTEKLIRLIKEQDPMGQGESLNEITNYGFKFLEKISSPRREGFHDWGILKESMLKNSDLIEFHAWGIFLEKFTDKLASEYKKGNFQVLAHDPNLALEMLDDLIDENYDFIDLRYIDFDDEDE